MSRSLKDLVAKITMLGDEVNILNETTLAVTRVSNGKTVIVVRDGNNVTISNEYDSVSHIEGTDYNIVKDRNKYSIVYKSDSKNSSQEYSELSSSEVTDRGVYNIIAKLSNGLYGVIDIEDNVVIPFCHSNILLYRVDNKLVYVGDSLDCSILYDDTGDMYQVSRFIGTRGILVGKDYIIIYDIINNNERYLVYSLDGTLLIECIGEIVNKGEYYQLVDYNENVILDKVYIAEKIIHK